MTILERYADSFDLSPIALMLVSEDGTIVLANREFEVLFEYPSGTLVGQPVECLLPTVFRNTHPALRNVYGQKPTKRQMGQGRDLEGLTRTGRRVPLELGLEPVSEAGHHWVLVTAIDTTARQENEALVRATLDAAASAMIMVASDGSIVSANNAAYALFGYDETELSGESIDNLVPQSVRAKHRAFRDSFFATSNRRSMGTGQPIYGRHKDGTEFRLEAALTPVEVSGKKLVLATIVDLSERLAAERALAAQKSAEAQSERLTRLNDALSQFAYSVSHDLKAPLVTIEGMLKLCLDDLLSENFDELADNLRRLRDMSARSAAKVESVLKLAKMGNEPLAAEPIDLPSLIQQLWEDLTLNVTAPIQLKVNDALQTPFVGNAQVMGLVMQNLLSNALKFRDFDKPDNQVSVKLHSDQESVEIVVSDNGIGFDNVDSQAVFDMFKRLTKREGDGLGLAIIQRYVSAMGGEVSVSSTLGERTDFTLRLPRR